MGVIQDLWYGNIIPHEEGLFAKTEFKELLGYESRNHKKLEETLTDEQKELFEILKE